MMPLQIQECHVSQLTHMSQLGKLADQFSIPNAPALLRIWGSRVAAWLPA